MTTPTAGVHQAGFLLPSAAAAHNDAHRNAATLRGIQSREWRGSGFNRSLFDDSDGQLRMQLATSHAVSQLTLGHLIHQAGNYHGSFRGEGFELRTDDLGAGPAEAGLWLSTYIAEGEAPAGDAVGPAALLKQALAMADVFGGIAAPTKR